MPLLLPFSLAAVQPASTVSDPSAADRGDVGKGETMPIVSMVTEPSGVHGAVVFTFDVSEKSCEKKAL